MNWFKSVWLKMRKSNGLPGGTVLISTDKQPVNEVKEVKVRKPRTKKKTNE